MQPTVFVDHFSGSFLILVVSQHYVRTLTNDFANDIFRVGGKDLYIHTGYGFSARTRFEPPPVFVTDDRTAFRHSISYGIREIDHFQELFNLLIESGTSYDYRLKFSSERLNHLFAHRSFNLIVDDGHCRSFQFRKYTLLDNLFDDKRNSDNQIRFYLFESLEDYLRTRHTGQEVDVATDGKFIKEFECQTIHMRHRKHRYNLVSGLQVEYFVGELRI